MTQDIAIRQAEVRDAATIHHLLESLAAATGKPGAISASVADIERYGFADQPRFTALLANHEGADVGLLLCFPEYSSWRGRPGLYVQDLFVAKAARGQGLARALLAQAARRTQAEGGTYLRLSVETHNISAREFYARTGFADHERERMLVLEGPAFDKALYP